MKYYEFTENNKWFYSIVKHLPKETRLKYLDKYAQKSIDPFTTIEMPEKFSLKEFRTKNYSLPGGVGVNIKEFLNDLKRILVIINNAIMDYIIKDYDANNKIYVLKHINNKQFELLMMSINIGKYYKEGKLKTVNAFMIYNEGRNKNLFMKDGMSFYSEDPDIFTYFRGYNHTLLDSVNESKINIFLNHVQEVIANNNEELYNYILNWISYIMQNPNGKTDTALVLTGAHRCGKTIFCNMISKLLKGYAIKNSNNIEHIIGKLNTLIENKKLIVCNELESVDTNKYINLDV